MLHHQFKQPHKTTGSKSALDARSKIIGQLKQMNKLNLHTICTNKNPNIIIELNKLQLKQKQQQKENEKRTKEFNYLSNFFT